ncbi:MAG: hypothetical protein ACFE85_09640 [Candidatus Hodarchaeota archaeon]
MLKNKTKVEILSISIISLIIIGMFSTTVYGVTYQVALKKGTEQFNVEYYNDSAWKSTVNSSSTPNEWFVGDADVTDAKSKKTVMGWNYITWETYDVFVSVFLSTIFNGILSSALFLLLESQGYNETTINANYTSDYLLWYGLQAVWNFNDEAFEEEPSYSEGILILQNPLKYKIMLEDYNNLAEDLNSNFAIQMAGYSFPNLTADEFLWQLAFNGLALAKPFSDYALELVNELGCENVTVNTVNGLTSLRFEQTGETNYTVEFSYGLKGTLSSFTVKDIDDNIIYQIISTNSDWIFYTILIIGAVGISGLIGYTIFRRKKLKR